MRCAESALERVRESGDEASDYRGSSQDSFRGYWRQEPQAASDDDVGSEFSDGPMSHRQVIEELSAGSATLSLGNVCRN